MDAPHAIISRRAAERIRAGHVWVYRSDVEQMVLPESPSRLVAVFDSRGNPLGTALYSASSQIALRVVSSRNLDQVGWIGLFRERLRSAIQFRREMQNEEVSGTDSYRLVFSEADFLPGLIADKYNDLVVVQLLTQGMDTGDIRASFTDVIVEEIRPKAIYERREPRIQELEQLGPADGGPLFLAEEAEAKGDSSSTIFHLNGLRFHYDVSSGQKTGAFLDQRENYAAAALHSRGDALDICTYQGGFAMHLARVCERVTGVDASREALEVAELNLQLNQGIVGASSVDWIEANAFDLLRDWSATGRVSTQSCLISAFAKSKRAARSAPRV